MTHILVTTILLGLSTGVSTSVLTFETEEAALAASKALGAYTPSGVRRIIEFF